VIRPLCRLLLAACSFGAPAFAQEKPMRHVEAHVTAVSGASVYLDQGRDGGLEPGDHARAFPPGGAAVELIVRTVSRQSARCEPVATALGLSIGATVDVLVPEDRFTNAQAAATDPRHPPWTSPSETWSADTPLLAPAQSVAAEDRPTQHHGRWYSSFDPSFENVSDSQRYLLATTGLELLYDNPFGLGDSIQFEGQLFYRDANVGDGQNDSETTARLDRFSWRVGGTRDDPTRIEVGRFLHSDMPMLGMVDGVEYVQRLDNGDRVGASAGFMPEWTPEMHTGDDVETALFYRHVAGDDDAFSLAFGAQKTWHKGTSDRDLLASDLSWRANDKLSLFASAWVDYYDSNDAPKSTGFELTQLQFAANYRVDTKTSLGVSATHVRWPVLLRNELPPATLDTIADGQVDRAGVYGWRDISEHGRLSARLDHWTSNLDAGTGGELDYALRDVLYQHGEVSAGLFANEGEFTSLDGARISANKSAGTGFWTLTYELAQNDQADFNGTQSSLLQQVIRATWDGEIGDGWDLSVNVDERFGDQQGSTALGFWLQRRF
jgi:hypothetical protein